MRFTSVRTYLRPPVMGWSIACVLLVVLLGALPAIALSRPVADPTILLVHTGRHALAVVTDTRGRRLVLGGSEGRTAATAALDRLLPPWDRTVHLLLVPPPHAAQVPGALEVLVRRPVTRASLLGLAAQPHPSIDAWQGRQPAAPVAGRAVIDLGAEARLRLDTGDDAAGGGALAVIERGEVRLLLLFGEVEALAASRQATAELMAPAAVALMIAGTTLPSSLAPPLAVTMDGQHSGWGGAGRRIVGLVAGESLRIVLRPDRLLIQGIPRLKGDGGTAAVLLPDEPLNPERAP